MNLKLKVQNEEHKDIINRYRSRLPADVFSLSSELGIRVKETDSLPENVSGFITEIDGEVVSCLNEFDSFRRQRFTLAHQIGHFILHKDKLKEGFEEAMFCNNTNYGEEEEANNFAADLLMPEVEFRKDWDASKINSLSNKFVVSQAAVITRAVMLGLVELSGYDTYLYYA